MQTSARIPRAGQLMVGVEILRQSALRACANKRDGPQSTELAVNQARALYLPEGARSLA